MAFHQHWAESWFKQAKFDLEAARLSFNHGYYEWTSFQSQQAAEKSIKGLLVLLDGYAPRGHHLGGLLGLADHLDSRVRSLKVSTAAIEAATFVSRYPFAIPQERVSPHEFIQKEDAEECLVEATEICSKMQHFITSLMRPSLP